MTAPRRDPAVVVAYRGDLYRAAQTDVTVKRAELIKAVREANAAGLSEYRIATEAGVTRQTVRVWLGKGTAR